MITSDNAYLTSAVILTTLILVAAINYAGKFIFESDKPRKATVQTYDPDLGLESSPVCIFSGNPHSTRYNDTPCFNKTLLHWYNPWLRHSLWTKLWAEAKAKIELRPTEKPDTKAENATEAPGRHETPTACPPEGRRKPEGQNQKEKPVEFVYSVLVGLLLVSGVVACWEVCKDKLKRNETAAAKAQERQCSLADFTIKRHLRRESQQQTGSHLPRQPSLELTAKVTQNLIHQSSLDRAFPKHTSEALSSLETRRNSAPLNLSDIQPTAGAKSGKRQSMDISPEDMASDLRRKPRHFIRRH